MRIKIHKEIPLRKKKRNRDEKGRKGGRKVNGKERMNEWKIEGNKKREKDGVEEM